MGGIAIWCMHYIGNRAIVLGGGAAVLQIAYSPGFTALSFFVPIVVLLVAFTALGSNDRVSILRVLIGGSLAGSAICGMHYLGQTGISNYVCVYEIKNIVGAAVIAVVATIVALSVFFVLGHGLSIEFVEAMERNAYTELDEAITPVYVLIQNVYARKRH